MGAAAAPSFRASSVHVCLDRLPDSYKLTCDLSMTSSLRDLRCPRQVLLSFNTLSLNPHQTERFHPHTLPERLPHPLTRDHWHSKTLPVTAPCALHINSRPPPFLTVCLLTSPHTSAAHVLPLLSTMSAAPLLHPPCTPGVALREKWAGERSRRCQSGDGRQAELPMPPDPLPQRPGCEAGGRSYLALQPRRLRCDGTSAAFGRLCVLARRAAGKTETPAHPAPALAAPDRRARNDPAP